MTCPACNNTRGNKRYDETNIGLTEVYRCKKCGAVFGRCYLGDSYRIVLPYWHDGDADETFYYDLETVGSRGVERRHGWAHKGTRRIVQVG
jgi:hypothetical protein